MILNLKNIKCSSSPFEWFILDKVINEEIFQEIKNEVKLIFDDINAIDHAYTNEPTRFDGNLPQGTANIIGGGSSEGRNAAQMVIDQAKNGGSLEKICNEFLDKDVQRKLYRALVPVSFLDLKSIFPVKIHPENHRMTIFDFIFYKNCYVNLKLSSYTSNFGLAQHKDHGNKVTALLFYFGFTDDLDRNGCSTQIFEVTDGNYKWSKKEAPQTLNYYDEVKLKLVHEIQSLPNRLFGFRKTKHSWHGVDPFEFPLDVRREALQINLMKHYKATKNLEKLLFVLNNIKSVLRPIVKRLLGYK